MVIGRISKQWAGLDTEMFTDADHFGVQFPMDLDVKIKAVVLAACFLIVSVVSLRINVDMNINSVKETIGFFYFIFGCFFVFSLTGFHVFRAFTKSRLTFILIKEMSQSIVYLIIYMYVCDFDTLLNY